MIILFFLAVFLFCALIALGESYYERDWPRDTGKFALIAAILLLCSLSAFGQNTRFDLPIYTVQAQGGNLLPVYAIPGAGVKFYSCTGSTCTTLATTYISATSMTTCPTSPVPMQVTLNGTSTCVPNADPYGNMGGWFQTGQYMATITAPGNSFNYYFTIGSGTFAGVQSVQGTAPIQVNGVSGVAETGAVVVSCAGGSCGGAGTVPVWPNIYYSAVAPNNAFIYASVIIGGTGYTVTVPSGCAGTFGNATADATLSTSLVFTDVTTSTTLCTLTFTSSSANATVTGSGGTLSSGDLISLTVATADTTLAGVTAELAGTTPGGGGGGGTTYSLTTSGTGGAATLVGSVFNIPQYQPQFTLTTSGTSGAATFVSNVLNIPQYSGGGGGGIPYPPSSGIPQIVSGTSWGATYNASTLIPRNFLPQASSTALGAAQCDGVTLTCPAGVFTVIAGAGGTVNSGGSYALPAYGSSASTTVGPSNIKTDSTGNNLIVPGSITSGSGAVLFSALPTCNTALGPAIRSISDPAVTTWGSTASGTGTAGTTNELVFCDAGTGSGTWTVFAK